MALETGTKLGPYEIISPLGAGGMGEVYLANDAKLDRKVAIKVLPELMTRDKERVARFEREAKLLASLNHPNIAAIHGFDDSDGTRFLVMEYVEGETLGSHLKNGPVAVEDALDIAKQISEALEAAHEQGVIHRDLKPANVMIREDGTVKVLDFGLAKAMTEEPSGEANANSPTITANFTRPGVVLGTAAYMSPEQARGRALDKRTDIWSFGIILFECLTGETLFRGETATDSMGAIMHKDPEWSLLPPSTPPTIQLLLRRCLTKDRKRRLHDIADARIELENALVDPTSTSLGLAQASLDVRRRWLPTTSQWAVLTCVLAVTAAAIWWSKPTPNDDAPIIRNRMTLSNDLARGSPRPQFDISLDGTHFVYIGMGTLGRQLYLRRSDDLESRALANATGAHTPIFSPDGQWIAFWSGQEIRKISTSGGPSIRICSAPNMRGAHWGLDDTIVFAPERLSAIWRVSANGGQPERITNLDSAEEKASHRWPFALPDGKHILYTETDDEDSYVDARIVVSSMDGKTRKVIVQGGTDPHYVPTGHVLFVRDNTLMAVPFDDQSLTVTGSETPMIENVSLNANMGAAQYAVSDNGILVFSTSSSRVVESSLVWVDRTGKNKEQASQHTGTFLHCALSPEGTHIAVTIASDDGSSTDIWVIELERDMLTRLTVHELPDIGSLWSHDQQWIYFSSSRDGPGFAVWRKRADGTGEAERIGNSPNLQVSCSLSPDGQMLVYEERDETFDLLAVHVAGEHKDTVVPLIKTQFSERDGQVSPDGKWLAYVTDVTGTEEVYVQRFPTGGQRIKVSAGSGESPRWSADGSEIIYLDDKTDKLYSVSVAYHEDLLRPQLPQLLFEWDSSYRSSFDISPDGERFLTLQRGDATLESTLTPIMVTNWFKELKAKVPIE